MIPNSETHHALRIKSTKSIVYGCLLILVQGWCVAGYSRNKERWHLIFTRVFIDSLLALMTLLALFRFQRINTFVIRKVLSQVFKSLVVPAQSLFFITLHIYNHILSIYYQTHSNQLTRLIQGIFYRNNACSSPLQRSFRSAPRLAGLG